MSLRGYRTLLLDLDPHGSMTAYFRHDPDRIGKSVYQLFQAKKGDLITHPGEVIHATRYPNLFLLPASTALATLDRQLGNLDGMGLVIQQALKEIQGRFDVAIIDCPPQLGVLMVNALAACQNLVIPVQTEFLALKGLERMQRTLMMITRAQHKSVAYTILPTLYDSRTRASVTSLALLRQRYAADVWRGFIPIDTQFRDASAQGVPLPILAPRGRGTLAYTAFVDDFLGLDMAQAAQQEIA